MTKDMTSGSPMKLILGFSVPLLFGFLFQQFYNLVDTLIVGRFLGVDALAAVGSTGSLNFLIIGFCMGVCNGFAIPLAHRFGAGDYKAMRAFMMNAVYLAVIFAAVMTVFTVAFCRPILQLMQTPENIIDDAYTYIVIIFAGIPATYPYNLVSGVIRSMGDSKTPLIFLALAAFVNIGLDLLLIIVFPMGVAGAALGTLCARILEVVLVAVYARLFNREIRLRFKYVLHTDKILFRDFMQYALPVVVNEVLWGLGTAANTAILGHMGSAAVAANSVAQVARQLATVVSFGLSSAAAIYLGKTIGERKTEYAKAYAKRFLILSVIMGALGGAVILAVSPLAAAALTLTGTAKEYLKIMFFVMSYFVVGQAINTTLVVGVFRSGGDTRFGLILDMTTMWCCSILFGFLAAFVFKLSVPVVYVILMSDEIIKIPITYKRYRSYKWLNDVTR